MHFLKSFCFLLSVLFIYTCFSSQGVNYESNSLIARELSQEELTEKQNLYPTPKVCTSRDSQKLAYIMTESGTELTPVTLNPNIYSKTIPLDFPSKILAFSGDGKNAYLTALKPLNLCDYLVKVDLTSGALQKLNAPAEEPESLVINSKGDIGYAYYTSKKQIIALEFQNNTFSHICSVEDSPCSLVLNEEEDTLYIAFTDRTEITAIHLKTKQTYSLCTLEHYGSNLTLSSDSKEIYAFNGLTSKYSVIDLETAYVKSLKLATPSISPNEFQSLKLKARKEALYFAEKGSCDVYKINLKNSEVESILQFEEPIDNLEFCPEPELEASFYTTEAYVGLPVKFDASHTFAKKEGKLEYHWNFGDGLSAFTEEPIIEHLYHETGEFLATLTTHLKVEKPNSGKEVLFTSSTKAWLGVFSNNKLKSNSIWDKEFASPFGGTIPVSIAAQPTPSSITLGQSFIDHATVTGDATFGSPTGQVTFYVGATMIGSPVNLVAGPANTATADSIAYTPINVGTYQLNAVYSGDTNYDVAEDDAPTNSVIVSEAITQTTLSAAPNPSVFGQSVLLTANVILTSTGSSIPTGTVTFYDTTTSTTLGTSTLISGTATLPVTNFSVGDHDLQAIYNPDPNFATSTSNTFKQTVQRSATATSVTTSGSPSIFGTPVTFTATVTATAPGSGTPTGSVIFKDGSLTLSTVPLSGGVATYTTSALSTATHTITATYQVSTNFSASVSPNLTQVVDKGTTTTTLSSLPSTTTYGQSTTLTATVAVATGSGTPTGSINFFSDGVLLQSVSLTGLTATLNVADLSVGTHTLTATYVGDTNFTTSTGTSTQIVNKAVPVITLVSSSPTSTYGQNVIFTSTVSAPTALGLPSGTVEFYDGATLIGSGTLSGTGTTAATTFATKLLEGGTHQITARFLGDGNFEAITSSPSTPQIVQKVASSTIIFTTSPNPTEIGQPVTLQANVIGSVANPPSAPLQIVAFYDGATFLGNGTLTQISPTTSSASLTITNFTLGTHPLRAEYAGDINYLASNSAVMNQTVVPTTTSNTLTTSSATTVWSQPITFTSVISSNIPGGGNPTGLVQFYNGAILLGSGTLSNLGPNSAQATLVVNSANAATGLTIGSHVIKATYGGDGNYTSSTSSGIVQTIIKDDTLNVLTVSPNPSLFGQTITLTSTLTPAAPGTNIGIATGVVTFYNGATILGTGTVNSLGVATYSTFTLYPGTYNLSARYSGDVNLNPKTSNTVSQVVTTQLPTVSSVTSLRNSSPVNVGVTYSATVTAFTGIPTGTVRFYDGGVLIGTGTLNANGVAQFTQPGTSLNVAPLAHNITVEYVGDANFLPSPLSPIYIEYIVPYDTTTTLTITTPTTIPPTTSPNHAEQSNSVLTATVVPTGLPSPIPVLTGTVIFYEGNTALSGPILVPPNGVVTFSPNNLHFGNQVITAVYSGDQTQFATSTSNPVTTAVQQTNMLTTQTVLTASPNPAYFCQNVTLRAVVTATQGFFTPTGSVTFFDGTQSLGTATLDNNGVALLDVSTLSSGVHTLKATYNSDSNYAFSFSNTYTQTINPNPTTTTLSIIPGVTSTPYGQELTFVAKVLPTFGTAAGVVVFSDQEGPFATIELDATGTATYVTTNTETGVHIFTATYDPDCCGIENACFGESSNDLVHTVTSINPKLVLSSNPNPSIYGQQIVLTGDVTAYGVGTPSGTVTFYNGTTVLGTSPIIQGKALLTVPFIPAGIVIFRATYNGDENFIQTNFPADLHIIQKAPVRFSLISLTANPSKFGQTVAITATVVTEYTYPTGSVTFYDDGVEVGTITLDANGLATMLLSNLQLGLNNITGIYSGDSNYLTATGPAYPQFVEKADTVTKVVSSSPNPSIYRGSVNFNIAVSALSPGSGVPTGNYTAFFGSTQIGSGTLVNGNASFSTNILPVGTQSITVNYLGSTTFNPSNTLATQTVNLAVSAVSTLTSSSPTSVYGQMVTFSTKVTSTSPTSVIPTGTVTFLDGTTELGTATLDAAGNATLSRSTLTVGTHIISVKYSGNANFAPATSANLTQTVTKASTTTTVQSSIPTSVYGQPVTLTATVAPVSPGNGVPTGTVKFTNGLQDLGSGVIGAGGIVSITTSPTSLPANAAAYTITAQYIPDASSNFTTSSGTTTQKVNAVSTITSVVSSLNPAGLGDVITFDVTVTAVNTGIVIPNGTVTASYGSTIIGTGTLNSNGKISFLYSALPAGTLPIVFTYSGNSNFSPSSTTLDQTITKASTTTTLVSSLPTSHVGEAVTFTANVTAPSGVLTGTIAFFDSGTLIGTQTISAGSATLTTSSLTLGNHNIRAVYSGDTSYATSSSAIIVQQVIAATTSTTLTTSLTPAQKGQQIILTATVSTVLGSGSPVGNVTFKEGATVLGTAAVSGNIATLTLSNLPVGTHNIIATFLGSANFATSASSPLAQVIVAADTTIDLTANPNPSVYGELVSITATVQAPVGGGVPTGTVNFFEGATLIGTQTLSAGQATLTLSNLTVGTHNITANFVATAPYANSTTIAPLPVIVNQGSSLTSITSNLNPSMFGQAITLTVTVTGSGTLTPTGTVDIKDGSTTIGTATLSGGIGTFITSTLSLATHPLTAVYTGNSVYNGSTSPLYSQVVNAVATTTTVNSNINPSIVGTPVTFDVTVVSNVGTSIPTGGQVSVRDGTNIIGTATLVNGAVSITTSTLTAGPHSISAVYLGSSPYLASSSSAFTQTVNQGTTQTVLTTSNANSPFGTPITLTAQVSVLTGVGIPTGSVTFFDQTTGSVLGTGFISSAGVAVITESDLSVGLHNLVAIFNGDPVFLTSTSAVLAQTITLATTTTQIIAITPNPAQLFQTITFYATVSSPAGTPQGTLSFYDNGVLLDTVNLSDGLAIYSNTLSPVGNHPITATYNPSGNFSGSTSASVIVVVTLNNITETTQTTVTSNNLSSNFGQSITISFHVQPITGVPVTPLQGSVTLYSGSVPLGNPIPLDASGNGSFTTDTLPPGLLNIVALYSGDAVYSASTGTYMQQVNPIGTTSNLSSSVNPSSAHQPVTFTSTITSLSSAIPTGSVSFFDGSTLLGTVPVLNAGPSQSTASFTTDNLTTSPPDHTITAVFNPDTGFATSTATLEQTVNAGATASTILTASPNPSIQGETVTFIGSVSSANGVPNGTAIFYENGISIGTAPVFNGFVVFNTSLLQIGSENVTFEYTGSPDFSASVSPIYVQVVQTPSQPSNVAVSSSINPALVGQSIVFNALVSGTGPIPTGTVTFYDGSLSLGTALVINGSADLSNSSLTIGSHSITAIYSGDSNYSPAQSLPYIQVIIASPAPSTPTNFKGCQVVNKYVNFDDIVNVLTWVPPQEDSGITGYEIYRDASLTDLVGAVDNQCPYRIEDGNRKKKKTYTYYLVAVNEQGVKSSAVSTIVKPHAKSKNRRFEVTTKEAE